MSICWSLPRSSEMSFNKASEIVFSVQHWQIQAGQKTGLELEIIRNILTLTTTINLRIYD